MGNGQSEMSKQVDRTKFNHEINVDLKSLEHQKELLATQKEQKDQQFAKRANILKKGLEQDNEEKLLELKNQHEEEMEKLNADEQDVANNYAVALKERERQREQDKLVFEQLKLTLEKVKEVTYAEAMLGSYLFNCMIREQDIEENMLLALAPSDPSGISKVPISVDIAIESS